MHAHIGSQLTHSQSLCRIPEKGVGADRDVENPGHSDPVSQHRRGARHYLFGRNAAASARTYADAIMRLLLQAAQCEIIMEPGRVIVGNAGVLLTRVLYIKETGRQNIRHRGRGHERFAAAQPVPGPSRHPAGSPGVRHAHRKTRSSTWWGPFANPEIFSPKTGTLPTMKAGESPGGDVRGGVWFHHGVQL